jgi:short-subunit dehydrogenase
MKTKETFAVVTGAGRGLGRAISLELASQGKNVILIAREGEYLMGLCRRIEKQFHVKTRFLEINFLDADAMDRIANWLNPFEIDVLVNNAGLGGSNYFETSDVSYIDAIIQVNVRTVSLMCRMLIPKLKLHRHAYILNVSSMAACCPIAYKTVYPASKAFVYSLSRSLSEELKNSGISVCVIQPGPIKTNEDVIKRIEKQGWWVKMGLLSPAELASIAVRKMYSQRKVVIPGWINKINWLLIKLLPASIRIPLVSSSVRNELFEIQLAA